MKNLILTAMALLAGVVFAGKADLSKYSWAVIGDSISDPDWVCDCGCKAPAFDHYYHFIARDTGIRVVYTNAVGGTGYKKTKGGSGCFSTRIHDRPLPNDVDVVTIFGSINDWSLVTGGNVGSPTDAMPDSDSLSAYINAAIDLIRQQAPKAKIILVSGIYYGGIADVFQEHPRDALKAIATARGIEFHDWLAEDTSDPLDFRHISDNPASAGSFASQYAVDWLKARSNPNATFGHPNALYHEISLASRFQKILVDALGTEPEPSPITLGDPMSRPLTDYNGSEVSVSFAGEIPEGADVSANVTLGGVDYAGTVRDSTVSFTISPDVVTAGHTYDGTITVSVGDKNYTKDVTLAQGTFKVDEKANWICESAAVLNATGMWSGDKIAVADGLIEVSNAVFAAANPSVSGAVVAVDSTFDFGGANEDSFRSTDLAGVKVVKVGNANRYAFLTGSGIVTNLEETANVKDAVAVKTVIDFGANTIVYSVGGRAFGPYQVVAGASRVAGVRYDGATAVSSLSGSYRTETLDTNLAKSGETEYATVAEAFAKAGSEPVTLLWDASWAPEKAGDYKIAKGGYSLVIGGDLAYSVKDNGDGTVTVTVTVTGGEPSEAPAPASITFSGSTVKVGVSDVKPDLWYALEKTTDLTKPFEVDESTWTKGSDLIGGDKELAILLRANEPQAFYSVVVSASKP